MNCLPPPFSIPSQLKLAEIHISGIYVFIDSQNPKTPKNGNTKHLSRSVFKVDDEVIGGN